MCRYWNKELWSSLYIHLLNCNKKPNVIENLLKNDSYWTSNNQKCLTFDANTSSMMGNESQSEAPYASIPIYMYKLQVRWIMNGFLISRYYCIPAPT